MRYFSNFSSAISKAHQDLAHYGQDVDPGHWQGVRTAGKPDLVTREVTNWSFAAPLSWTGWSGDFPRLIEALQEDIQPNLPWADYEFEDRVCGYATNPHSSLPHWPWWRGQSDTTQVDGKFSHTYSERFWPKSVGTSPRGFKGLHFPAGDYKDVVNLLWQEPMTRQAYLPIFFPEDTGAVHGGRIPCTLGYQFLLRNDELSMWYFIRSCDYVRHFRDDIYLACRLLIATLQQLVEKELRSDNPQLWVDVTPGELTMHICSLHYHKADEHLVRAEGTD